VFASDIDTMLSRTTTLLAGRVLPRSVATSVSTATASRFSSEAAAAAGSEVATAVTLNFSLPYDSIYNKTKVAQVILPGVEGEYGVTPGHVPYVAQLKPGVLQILHEDSASPDASEKYFVAGGYAFTHANSVTVRPITWGFPSIVGCCWFHICTGCDLLDCCFFIAVVVVFPVTVKYF
jgi:hypothetical protein